MSRLVGTGIAKELIYTARNVKAEEAKSIGLVNKVVPAESMLDEAKAMMQTILSKAPLAVRYAKIAINEGIQMDLYRGLELEKDVCALHLVQMIQKKVCQHFWKNVRLFSR